MPIYFPVFLPNVLRGIKSPLDFEVKNWTRCCHLGHTTSSWAITILWVPSSQGRNYWCLNEKPQGRLRENGDFSRKKKMFQFWSNFLSVLPLRHAIQVEVVARVLLGCWKASYWITVQDYVKIGWSQILSVHMWEKRVTRTPTEEHWTIQAHTVMHLNIPSWAICSPSRCWYSLW